KQPGLRGAFRALFVPEYKDKLAVNDLSFQVERGEMVGYIGVNGAGKSTTIKMLTGILAPTGGTVRVLGRDPNRERVANARDIGVVFGQRTQLWWDLAYQESLNLIARIYDLPEARYRRLLGEFSEHLGLAELLPLPVRSMSLGQKMRAELAATLIHEPRVVYLDEPTIGLDIVVKERIREFIKEQNRASGLTVMLTTHDLGDIEELCERVIIIDDGHLIFDGAIATIKERFSRHRLISFETAARPGELTLPPGVTVDGQEERRVTLRFDRTLQSAASVAASVMSQIEVLDLSVTEPDLASVIRQIYTGADPRGDSVAEPAGQAAPGAAQPRRAAAETPVEARAS
ncbi:MAG TPA: ATP-binding cassette domain-containing protein, partial [Deinococcales bacterium]|nr:ATP-binding cassette domain-containing protein [Deinococcales bacterium]